MVKKKHSLARTDPSITSASRLYDRFPRERAGGGGGGRGGTQGKFE